MQPLFISLRLVFVIFIYNQFLKNAKNIYPIPAFERCMSKPLG
jgi:hypothetical protein